jgi:hypothetical protein
MESDGLYFSLIAMTTVGFGDFRPWRATTGVAMYDLHLEGEPAHAEIRRALARAFGLDDERIVLVSEVCDMPAPSPSIVACVVRSRGGQFRVSLEIYPGEPTAVPEAEFASRVCRELGCRCLISDDSLNPYRWLLVTAEAEPQPVQVSPLHLDDDLAFVLEPSGSR